MRIALLADGDTNNGFYRGILPMTALLQRGHEVRLLSTDEARPPVAELGGVDVLLVHRYFDARAELLVREAKRRGAAVVWDDDDDPGANPKGSVLYRRYGGLTWERRLAAMRRIFASADLVTAPSTYLATRLQGYGAPEVRTIENYIPGLFLEHRLWPKQGFTVGWVAGGEHQLDAEALPIASTLQRLLDAHPDVHVISIGLGLGLRSERYRHIKKVALLDRQDDSRRIGRRAQRNIEVGRRAPGGLANYTAMFDVGIAPLTDNPLNRARSNIKLKEYAAGGAAWLASPVGPYHDMGEKQGGRLVADECWYEEISRLAGNPRDVRKLAKRAGRWAAGETIERNAHRWEEILSVAVERSERRSA